MYRRWLTSLNRKTHQRAVNKVFRDINKSIEKDELWKGRFVIKQHPYSTFTIYEDKSGAEFFTNYYLIDKKTGRTHLSCGTSNDILNPHKMFIEMNNFIVHICQVWLEEPRPHIDNTEDYRKVAIRINE